MGNIGDYLVHSKRSMHSGFSSLCLMSLLGYQDSWPLYSMWSKEDDYTESLVFLKKTLILLIPEKIRRLTRLLHICISNFFGALKFSVTMHSIRRTQLELSYIKMQFSRQCYWYYSITTNKNSQYLLSIYYVPYTILGTLYKNIFIYAIYI